MVATVVPLDAYLVPWLIVCYNPHTTKINHSWKQLVNWEVGPLAGAEAILLLPLGGAVTRVRPEATAYCFRSMKAPPPRMVGKNGN